MINEIKKSIGKGMIVIMLLVLGLISFSFVIPSQTYNKILQILSDILYWFV